MTASFLSPIAAGLLTQESVSVIFFPLIFLYHSLQNNINKIICKIIYFQQQSLDSWRRVFAVTAGVSCSTYIAYQIFGTADIQAWNYPDQKYPQSIQEDSCPLNNSSRKKSKLVPSRKNPSEQT